MEATDQYDYLLKFIIIGNSGTGKSCLLHYFLEGKFKQNSTHTIGVEFGSKVLSIGNKSIKLQIWDTAGQERFRSVSHSYYRGALGALILYDITNQDSFLSLTNWIKDARDLARPDISITVLGNKTDLSNERIISFVEAAKFCQENSVSFMETSVINGENTNEAFEFLTKTILDKIENGQLETNEIKPKIITTIKSNRVNSQSQKKCVGCSG